MIKIQCGPSSNSKTNFGQLRDKPSIHAWHHKKVLMCLAAAAETVAEQQQQITLLSCKPPQHLAESFQIPQPYSRDQETGHGKGLGDVAPPGPEALFPS